MKYGSYYLEYNNDIGLNYSNMSRNVSNNEDKS